MQHTSETLEIARQRIQIEDLAVLVKKLAFALNNTSLNNDLAHEAIAYLYQNRFIKSFVGQL